MLSSADPRGDAILPLFYTGGAVEEARRSGVAKRPCALRTSTRSQPLVSCTKKLAVKQRRTPAQKGKWPARQALKRQVVHMFVSCACLVLRCAPRLLHHPEEAASSSVRVAGSQKGNCTKTKTMQTIVDFIFGVRATSGMRYMHRCELWQASMYTSLHAKGGYSPPPYREKRSMLGAKRRGS